MLPAGTPPPAAAAPPQGEKKSSCAACKLRKRKCPSDCIFFPYFPGSMVKEFQNVQSVFKLSNLEKLLKSLPEHLREHAATSLLYEANARVKNPESGCVGYVKKLQSDLQLIHQQINEARRQLQYYLYSPNAGVVDGRGFPPNFQENVPHAGGGYDHGGFPANFQEHAGGGYDHGGFQTVQEKISNVGGVSYGGGFQATQGNFSNAGTFNGGGFQANQGNFSNAGAVHGGGLIQANQGNLPNDDVLYNVGTIRVNLPNNGAVFADGFNGGQEIQSGGGSTSQVIQGVPNDQEHPIVPTDHGFNEAGDDWLQCLLQADTGVDNDGWILPAEANQENLAVEGFFQAGQENNLGNADDVVLDEADEDWLQNVLVDDDQENEANDGVDQGSN